MTEQQAHQSPEFRQHLLRNALDRYGRNLTEPEASEFAQVLRRASRSDGTESDVLALPEVRGLIVSEPQLDRSLARVVSRLDNHEEFVQDLGVDGLDPDGLRKTMYEMPSLEGETGCLADEDCVKDGKPLTVLYGSDKG